VSGQQHAQSTLYPWERPGTHFTGGCPRVWMGRKSRPHQDLIPDHPVPSQSPYQLSYPAHKFNTVVRIIIRREVIAMVTCGSFSVTISEPASSLHAP